MVIHYDHLEDIVYRQEPVDDLLEGRGFVVRRNYDRKGCVLGHSINPAYIAAETSAKRKVYGSNVMHFLYHNTDLSSLVKHDTNRQIC
jgi:hypothetical protein